MVRSKSAPEAFTVDKLTRYEFVELTNLNPVTKNKKIVLRYSARFAPYGKIVVSSTEYRMVKSLKTNKWEILPHFTTFREGTGKIAEKIIDGLNFRTVMRYPDRKKIFTMRIAKKKRAGNRK